MAPIPASLPSVDDDHTHAATLFSHATSVVSNVHTLLRRERPKDPTWDPSAGSRAPESFNNKGYFALFALLGVAMVLISIWFFFWAKNGGFVWRKGDWDDYKSTVLRRKGPNGTVLSNATPSTDLGQRSIAGTFDNEKPQMTEVKDFGRRDNTPKTHQHHHGRHHHTSKQHDRGEENVDVDVRAYRHERAARVGGLNREHDGSHFGFSSTEGSEVMSNTSRTHLRPRADSPKKKTFMDRKREKKNDQKGDRATKKAKGADKTDKRRHESTGNTPRRPAERRPSLSTAADSLENSNEHSSTYYANYRPPVQSSTNRHESPRRHSSPRHTPAGAQQRSGRASPKKQTIYNRTPGSFDNYSEAGSSDLGTKSYSHHIPELSRGSRDTGFRRGATGRRRDSLSESE